MSRFFFVVAIRRTSFFRRLRGATLLPAVLAAGCGESGLTPHPDAGAAPDLTTPVAPEDAMNVVVSGDAIGGARVRVAALWTLFDFAIFTDPTRIGELGNVVTTLDVPVPATRPAALVVDRNVVSPQKALFDGKKSGIAIGSFVVYEDVNGNGRLDLVSLRDRTTPDRILGAVEVQQLMYAEVGAESPPFPIPPQFLGFHVVHAPDPWTPPPNCDVEAPNPEILPLDTPLPITVANAGTRLPMQLCAVVPDLQDCTPAPGETVVCNAEGSGFVTRRIGLRGTLCEQAMPCSLQECPPPLDGRPAFCP